MTAGVNSVPSLKTVIFADSVLAQPAVEMLLRRGWLAGLCMTRQPASAVNLRHLARLANVPLFETDRESLGTGAAAWLSGLRPDVLLTFTFPYRLPTEVLTVPRFGGFNLHGGKLPQYRGPQPVFWEIRNCETEGAITVHRMDDRFDHGGVVVTQIVPIGPEDTYGLHVVRLAFAAIPAIEALLGGLIQYGANLPAQPQDESRAAYQPRPSLNDLVVRWEEQSGDQIRGLVKACNPWNQGAFASIRGNHLRLTDVTLKKGSGSADKPPGVILSSDLTDGLVVNCVDGSALQLDVISMDEGILPGRALAAFGLRAGEQFIAPTLAGPPKP
jgi:methionyl-tRNA formyltransferase